MTLLEIAETLAAEVDGLQFSLPVTHVYNPLQYARAPHREYLRRYGCGPRKVLLVGMNPGPFGMAQTGVPFGDVEMVRGWLGIEAPVGRPEPEHPKRLVEGFACRRREVSGSRLWGWARDRWGTPERFFEHFFVANYCPLAFLEASGKNFTPDKLPAVMRTALFAACDRAIRQQVDYFAAEYVLGIGDFATTRLRAALVGREVAIGTMLHPSPANPKANAGWAEQADAALARLVSFQ